MTVNTDQWHASIDLFQSRPVLEVVVNFGFFKVCQL